MPRAAAALSFKLETALIYLILQYTRTRIAGVASDMT
jgi:hypothetical protein